MKRNKGTNVTYSFIVWEMMGKRDGISEPEGAWLMHSTHPLVSEDGDPQQIISQKTQIFDRILIYEICPVCG